MIMIIMIIIETLGVCVLHYFQIRTNKFTGYVMSFGRIYYYLGQILDAFVHRNS